MDVENFCDVYSDAWLGAGYSFSVMEIAAYLIHGAVPEVIMGQISSV